MSKYAPAILENIKKNYQTVTEKIASAAERSGRSAEDISIVAVTKNATMEQVKALIELGVTNLGENRAPQLTERAQEIQQYLADQGKDDLNIKWHMIGHLQRNKSKNILPVVSLIHSVDSLRLAEHLHSQASKNDQIIDILLQINTSGEQQKYGLPLAATIHLAEQINTMLHLRLRGIMTMAPHAQNPQDIRPVFTRTKELFNELQSQSFCKQTCNILSMGMSNDYEIAIEEGANVVRIGTALFAS